MSNTLESLIPHRAPMCFIDALTECTDSTATATVSFAPGHFAVAEGKVLETALVECVAQTVAAAIGHRSRNRGHSGAPIEGMLIAVTNFKIHSRPPADKQLHIEIRELRRLGPMLMVSGDISSEGQVIAAGELTLYA